MCDEILAEKVGFRNRPPADLSHRLEMFTDVIFYELLPFSGLSKVLRQLSWGYDETRKVMSKAANGIPVFG